MLTDLEGNKVNLIEKPNGHRLILGKSGTGKTFLLLRNVEQLAKKGKKILILDYSASFTDLELAKSKFRIKDDVRIINPFGSEIKWMHRGTDLQSALLNALVNSLNIGSYYQKKLLREALSDIEKCNDPDCFTFPKLMLSLEHLRSKKEDADSKKNLGHLLTRLAPYDDIREIKFVKADEKNIPPVACPVTILQLSDYPEFQRKFLTEFLSELFWQEVRDGKKRADIVLYDEFQNVSLEPGNALSTMLREGRKFELSVYLSSQFWGNYNYEAVDTLMQAGNMLLFRPVPKDLALVADLIDPERKREWKRILGSLQVGEAVLKGRYTINCNRRVCETPVICRVQSNKD